MEQQNHLEVQAQIAKVLASENIDVEFRNIETAAFDPVNRVLIVPQYRDGLSKSMYDLFIGHEVGHALFTPQISPDKVREDLPNFGQFVNVVEDVRIERKIRSRFPGLVKSFVRGYGDLLERKFFGDFDERPLSGRSLADRLNVFFKVGELNTGLEFFDTELAIKEQIESAETWEEVIAAAEVLYEYAQGEKKVENKQQQEQQGEEGESNDFEQGNGEDTENGEGTSSNEEESSDGEEERSEERGESSSESKDDVNKEGEQSVPSNGHENGDDFDEPSIETQQEFDKKRVGEIEDNAGRDVKNVYIDDVNLDDIIIGYSDLYRHLSTGYSNNYSNIQEVVKVMNNRWNKFRSENNKVVMSSAREFEMRKSADEFKRTKISKTGVIDMNALHKYRFTEDIFLKQAVVKDGKNHSLTMFIDWSGSMGHIMSDTISQLQVLALFCKKVNIPFEVYAFTNNFHCKYMHEEMFNQYYVQIQSWNARKRPLYKEYGGSFGISNDYALLNILSSNMSKSDFDTANMWLEYTKNAYSRRYGRYFGETIDSFAKWFCLGGTPLNETFAILPQLMERNSKKYNSQINNVVFLTDGAGGTCIRYVDPKYDNDLSPTYPMDIIIDKKTKNAYKNHSGMIMDVLSKRVKDRVNCNLINFHLLAPNPHALSTAYRDLGIDELDQYGDHRMSWNDIKISARSLKKNGHLVLDGSHYDRVFLISNNKIALGEENNMGELVAGQATKAQIKKALLKDTKGNKESRIIMNKFAGMVAA